MPVGTYRALHHSNNDIYNYLNYQDKQETFLTLDYQSALAFVALLSECYEVKPHHAQDWTVSLAWLRHTVRYVCLKRVSYHSVEKRRFRLVVKPDNVMNEATYKQVVKEIADKIGLPFDMASLTWSQLQGLPVTTGDPASYQKVVEHGLDYPVPQTTAEPVKQNATSLPYTPRPSGQKSMTMRIIDTLFNGFGDEGGRNVALTRFVGLLFNKWVDCDLETAYELTKIANSVTVEPLPIDELDRTFSSIARAEYRKRG